MSAVETLLGRVVDYAGLFPPASLSMESAVENYQRYLGGDFGWMLGGFLAPASRLGEFSAAFEKACCGEREAPWTLNIVCAGENPDDVRAIQDFQQGAVFIGSLETKAADARAAKEILERLPAARARYVEFPPEKAAEVLPVLADHGAWAKIRMGGVTAESVPASDVVARFLLQCVRERVAWKATAGPRFTRPTRQRSSARAMTSSSATCTSTERAPAHTSARIPSAASICRAPTARREAATTCCSTCKPKRSRESCPRFPCHPEPFDFARDRLRRRMQDS